MGHENTLTIILYISIQYYVFGRYVRAVIENKHDFFRGLRGQSVNLIPGKLQGIRSYRRNDHGLLYAVAVFVGNILRFLYFNFLADIILERVHPLEQEWTLRTLPQLGLCPALMEKVTLKEMAASVDTDAADSDVSCSSSDISP